MTCFVDVLTYLLPTAARFLFDRRIKNSEVKIASPAHNIEPTQVSAKCPTHATKTAQHTQICKMFASTQIDSI